MCRARAASIERRGRRLSPDALRSLLIRTGRGQDEGGGHIGPFPNLKRAIDELLAIQPPAAPEGLAVEEAVGCRVSLVWTDASHDEHGFRIERDDGAGWFTVADGLPAETTRHSDFVPVPVGASSLHRYRVFAFNGAGSSAPSNEIEIEMFRERPPTPATLRPSGCTTERRPELAWTAVPRAHTYYLVTTRQSDGSNPINQPGLRSTTFRPAVDQDIGAYWWKVKACNNQGCSDYSTLVPFEVREVCASALSVGDAAAAEGPFGTAAVSLALVLAPARGEQVSVRYATLDGSAIAGADYQAVSGAVTFAPGQSIAGVVVPLVDDGNVEGLERFRLRLSEPSAGVVLADPEGEATIVDDDAPFAATVGVYRPSNGTFYLRRVNVTGIGDIWFVYGIAGDVPIVGDWDGDGDDTAGVWRPSNQTFYLRNSNDTGIHDLLVTFGAAGDLPVVGDWDDDGIDEIGVFRPATSSFLLRYTNTPGDPDLVVAFGKTGDVPVAGDWDGDGRDTIGVYRPADRHFYLRNSNLSGAPDLIAHYGIPGDVPVIGDWNGDGLDTIGIWRPSRASFFLKDTIATGVADYPEIRLGNGQDKPIVGNWVFP